ncbi:MAG: M14 family zinc carboxypeptidase [Myxococcales bacterium]
MADDPEPPPPAAEGDARNQAENEAPHQGQGQGQGDRAGGRTVVGRAVLDRVDALTRAGLLSVWGRSRLGRPIVRGTFFPAAGAFQLLFVGGVHGDEPASVEALLELAARLGAFPARGAHNLAPGGPDGVAITIIPALNPDGVASGLKNAASDVDLNRNFPARNFVTAHAPGYHPGPAPLSEPETALLARLIEQQRIDAVVAVHAPFACVNYDGPAQTWAELVARASGWPVRENIGYPTPGSLGSWLGVDRFLPVLTLELPPGPLAGFAGAAAAALDAACAGCCEPGQREIS